MASRGLRSNTTKLRAVRSASFVVITCFAVPAFANAPRTIPCPDTITANLEVPAAELTATTVANEVSLSMLDDIAANTVDDGALPSEILSPLAEDAIRAAFAGDEERAIANQPLQLLSPVVNSNDVVEPSETKAAEPDVRNGREMHTRLPGISDDELARYKKQMFRRDI